MARRPQVTMQCRRLIAVAVSALWMSMAGAQSTPEIFRGADLALGERLIKEHRCVECHVRKVGGDCASIYRLAGRINSAGYLRGMVEECNTELNLGLFPEEVISVAAVLNQDHRRHR